MALQITNVNELKNAKTLIETSKKSYDESLDSLRNAIIEIQNYWQGEDSIEYQDKVLNLVNRELSHESTELEFEVKYLNRIITVLDNAQDQIKKRLND